MDGWSLRTRRILTLAGVGIAALAGVVTGATAGSERTKLVPARPLASFLSGSSMMRAGVVISRRGIFEDVRLDRGEIRSVTATDLTLRQRDGLMVKVTLSPQTRIELGSRSVPVAALRRGMQAASVRPNGQAADLVSATEPRTPVAPLARFFGPNMIRAQAVVRWAGSDHEYRVDRGRVKAVTATSLTLRERDGLEVTVPVASHARVEVNRRFSDLSRVRRGMEATTVRDGPTAPAEVVQAYGYRGGRR